mgnify:CR=1 FL=1
MSNNVFFPKYVEKYFDECPRCHSTELEGVMSNATEASPELLLPKRKLKLLRSTRGVPLTKSALWLCRDCGLLFQDTDPRELALFLKQYSKD